MAQAFQTLQARAENSQKSQGKMTKCILKNIAKLNLWLVSLLTLVSWPNISFASDSITYSIAGKMIDSTERFTMSLYSSIGAAYQDLYVKIAGIGLVLILSKYLFTRVPPLREMTSFSIAMIISSAIAFDPVLFKSLVYDTFFDTLYRFDQFVIQSSASNMPGIKLVTFNSLSGMFKTVDASLMEISKFALETAHEVDLASWDMGKAIVLRLEAYIIYLLYLFIGAYFLVIFTVSIFGAHMMIIMMPITISFYPFQRFRHYLGNCINGMFYYGLITVFACIAISLVVYISDDLVVEAARIDAARNAGNTEEQFPADFLTAAIMIGFLSIFIIKVSSEFASRVMNSASSQLGGAFPMIIAGATTMARAAATSAKVTPTVARGTAMVAGGTYAVGNWGYNKAKSYFAGGSK